MAKLTAVLGLASSGSVFAAIARLSEAGYLERVEGRIAPTKRFFSYPVLGSVRAGQPQPASQEAYEFLNVEDVLVREPNRTTFCHVRGDSMKDAGLLDGDVAVVETNSATEEGDIVVCSVDGQLTIKYLRKDADRKWFLDPANPAYKPIYPRDSLEIIGVVRGSFRTYRS